VSLALGALLAASVAAAQGISPGDLPKEGFRLPGGIEPVLQLRTYYFDQESTSGAPSAAWALGGWVGARSPWWGDFFQAAVHFYTSPRLTLLMLAGYLYYSVYRYFRGGEFHMRSRWMLLFSFAREGWARLLAVVRRHPYHRVAEQAMPQCPTQWRTCVVVGQAGQPGHRRCVLCRVVRA